MERPGMAFALLPRWTSALVADSSATRAATATARPAAAAVPRKSSLDFIMNGPQNGANHHQETTAGCTVRGAEATAVVVPVPPPTAAKRPKRQLKYSEKRQARACKVDGCQNYIINKGLCFRHGGGKKCSVEGCVSSAKHAGLCWKHGGSVKCSVEGCERRGKSRGVCWAHGGGTKCSADLCTKVAVSNGFCWAHGGGKRCEYEGCRKAASERTHNFCAKHHEKLKDGSITLEV